MRALAGVPSAPDGASGIADRDGWLPVAALPWASARRGSGRHRGLLLRCRIERVADAQAVEHAGSVWDRGEAAWDRHAERGMGHAPKARMGRGEAA